MTDAVVTPATVYLIVEGAGRYELQGVRASFGANGINICICTLAVGRKEGADTAVVANFERGTRATVFVESADITSEVLGYAGLTSDSYTLFRGKIDDFGPSTLQYGSFGLSVRLLGVMADLTTGTLSTSNIVPKSFKDTAVAWQYSQGVADPKQFDPENASVDLWDEMSDVFQEIATAVEPPQDSVTAFIVDKFGVETNQVAANILAEIEGSLNWNAASRLYIPSIVYNMNQMMVREWFYESFMNRIIGYGEMLKFSVIENGSGIRVVPWTPFFRRTSAAPITPDTYSALQWNYGEFRSYCGAVLVDGTGHDASVQGGPGLIVGSYKMPGKPFGQVHVGTVPAFFSEMTQSMHTGGGGVRSLLPANAEGDTTIGDRLAKHLTWEENFRGRSLQVTCPLLRTDIGPLEAVRVDFPDIPEIDSGVSTPAVYGSVMRVSVAIDAAQQLATTSYDIGYVRSYSQQKFQIDPGLSSTNEHPFFDSLYIGGRLDTGQPRGNGVI